MLQCQNSNWELQNLTSIVADLQISGFVTSLKCAVLFAEARRLRLNALCVKTAVFFFYKLIRQSKCHNEEILILSPHNWCYKYFWIAQVWFQRLHILELCRCKIVYQVLRYNALHNVCNKDPSIIQSSHVFYNLKFSIVKKLKAIKNISIPQLLHGNSIQQTTGRTFLLFI